MAKKQQEFYSLYDIAQMWNTTPEQVYITFLAAGLGDLLQSRYEVLGNDAEREIDHD